MKYKGYQGHVNYDDENKLFHGEVVELRDVITFQGSSVKELEQAFKDSIDEYIEFCQELGRVSEKLYNNSILTDKFRRIELNTIKTAKLTKILNNTISGK